MYFMTAVDERCGILGGLFFLGSAVVNGGGGGSVAVCGFFMLLVSVGETRWMKIVCMGVVSVF